MDKINYIFENQNTNEELQNGKKLADQKNMEADFGKKQNDNLEQVEILNKIAQYLQVNLKKESDSNCSLKLDSSFSFKNTPNPTVTKKTKVDVFDFKILKYDKNSAHLCGCQNPNK